jgi:signal transduction histidine kinase
MGVFNPQAEDYRWLLVSATPQYKMEEEKPYQVYASFSDITQLRRATHALQESESKLRNLYSPMAEGVCLHKLVPDANSTPVNYRIVGVNPRYEEIVGMKAIDIVDQLATDVYGGYEPPYFKEYLAVVQSQKPFFFETCFAPMDKHFFISVSPWDRDGFATIFSDITDRVRSEEALRKLNEELENRVVLRTSLLEAANKEPEAFSYSVSHDLRTPETDMNKLSREVFFELTTPAEREVILFTLHPMPVVVGDASMIRQVWRNLIGNAVKFSAPRTHRSVEIGSASENGENIYFIRDNGVGFDMEYADKLFGVFQRLHSSSEFEGTGVGLAIVQRIIHRHQGRIWAEAKEDEGAVFYFTLTNQ